MASNNGFAEMTRPLAVNAAAGAPIMAKAVTAARARSKAI
jgi:hypothetical protein